MRPILNEAFEWLDRAEQAREGGRAVDRSQRKKSGLGGIVNLADRGRLFPAPFGLSGAAQ